MNKIRIAVLVSGGGTNLQALIDAQANGSLQSGEIALVVSNKPGAYALERAKRASIETLTLTRTDCGSQEGFETALMEALDSRKIGLIVLAGFMSILSASFTGHYENRMINIHPSLIPSFCGKGYYGLHVHEKVLQRGAKVTGATVHFVDEDLDHGPILLQKAVEVREGDTPEVLQRRVMEEAEWILLPRAISLIAQDRVTIDDNRITHIKES